MPIRKEFRHFYQGKDWKQLRRKILKGAKNRCESCGKPLHRWIFTYTWQTWILSRGQRVRVYHMIWMLERGGFWCDQFGKAVPGRMKGLPRKIRVKLTVAHVDNDPSNMDDSNLKCWCTWCHLHFDQAHHKQTRATRKDQGRPLLPGRLSATYPVADRPFPPAACS